jgi:serine/threonine-protein kinase SRPK3
LQACGMELSYRTMSCHHDRLIHERDLLFCIPGMDLWSEAEVYERFGEPNLIKITRHDGQPSTPHAPEYAVMPVDPKALLSLCLTASVCVKFADFGEAFLSTGMTAAIPLHTPVCFAAPELQFLDLVGPASDIWSLACMMNQILSGRVLCPSFDADRNRVLREMVFTLGKFPDRWWRKWENRSDYY